MCIFNRILCTDLVKCRLKKKNKLIVIFSYFVHFTENFPISVQCFNPDVTITPAQPYTTDTPTTSTTASSITTSTVTSHVTSNVKSSTSTSSTVSPGTTQTEFSQTTATSTSYSTSSGDVFSSTVTNTEKVESTTGVGTGTTTLVRTSSTGKEDVTSNVKHVIHTSDFNGTVIFNPLITILSSFMNNVYKSAFLILNMQSTYIGDLIFLKNVLLLTENLNLCSMKVLKELMYFS